MKILFILENHYPNIGGVETLFKYLTEALSKKGHSITILTNQFDKSLPKQENLNGVTIIRVPFQNRYLFTLLAFFPALKLARGHDLIHTTSYNAGIPAFFAGLITRKKVIITFHEVWGKLWFQLPFMNKFSLSLHYLFEKFLLLLPFYKFIAVSQATASSLSGNGVKEEKIEMIYNGINYTEYLPTSANKEGDEPFNFIYFGRLGISKGLDILLDAIELLLKDRNDFILDLVIPTQPENFHNQIKNIISKKKLSDVIQISSDLKKTELISKISNSCAVIIPSYSEGFCFTAAESMAIGIPIISSGKGALAEVISGKHLTMETHDSIGLKKAMKKAINDDWTITPVRKFTLEDSIEQYLAMYSRIGQTVNNSSTN